MNVDKINRLFTTQGTDLDLFYKAVKLAYETAREEGLRLNCVVPKYRLSRCSAIGLCDTKRLVISIVIRHRSDKQDGGVWENTPLPWKEINDTMLHEVAHLKYPDHSAAFRQYEKYLIDKYTVE